MEIFPIGLELNMAPSLILNFPGKIGTFADNT
jgi:hypothetical protein